ncbi:MBL fold metallo-hydrolase [Alphaproteobacteria bacterium KMM 3653]|uniref:MBL fold metallo-hydrolase n=1 Tax=Harenicola maris TaxID=2841044 RepID=A0AAP2G8D8_9RHOB|nr:MBL fold metallo-hydrolase [Harenicola maris]
MSYLTLNRRAALMGGALAIAAPAIIGSATTAQASGADLPMRALAQFSLGDMRITVIDDQLFTVPTAIFGANVAEGSVDALFAKFGLQQEFANVQGAVFLVETEGHKVLIDTGMGDITLPDATPDNGRLFAGLKAVGVSPEEITHVFLTHGHYDHIGGVSQDGKACFPNAAHFMSQTEVDYWTAAPGTEANFVNLMIGYGNDKLNPIKDRIQIVADGDEIVAGITAIAAPGHTFGHMAVMLESNGEKLLHLIDTSVHYIVGTNEPTWALGIEQDPAAALETRERLFGMAADENLLVAGYHFPFPGVGRLSRTQDGAFLYTPVSVS